MGRNVSTENIRKGSLFQHDALKLGGAGMWQLSKSVRSFRYCGGFSKNEEITMLETHECNCSGKYYFLTLLHSLLASFTLLCSEILLVCLCTFSHYSTILIF